jgi:hypothetical protein
LLFVCLFFNLLILDVPDYQKKLIIDLMDGNIQEITKYSQDLLANPEIAEDAFELARQNLLSNPDLAISSGIPMEAVNDPILWKDFMKNSLNSFSSLLENKQIDLLKEGGVGDIGEGDGEGFSGGIEGNDGDVNPFDSLNNVFNEVLQTMHKHENQQQQHQHQQQQESSQQKQQTPPRRAKKASSRAA